VLTSGVSEVGKALALAKQQYLTACGAFGFGEYDVKVLDISTLYGLPMYEVQFPIVPPTPAVAQPKPGVKITTSRAKSVCGRIVPTDLIVDNYEVDLTGRWQQVEAASGMGSYFLLTGYQRLVHAHLGQPMLPKILLDVNLREGFKPHGVLLIGATYDDLYDFTPLITDPLSKFLDNNSSVSANWDYYASDGWVVDNLAAFITQQVMNNTPNNSADHTGLNAGKASLQSKLGIVPMQVRNEGRARRYNYLKLEAYQTSRLNQVGPEVASVQTSHTTTSGNVSFQVQVRTRTDAYPPAQALRVLVTYTFIGGGEWFSYDLSPDTSDPTGETWFGTPQTPPVNFQKPGVFFIQVLDSDGNVTTSTNKGLYDTWVDRSAIGQPRTIDARLSVIGEYSPTQPNRYSLFLRAVGDELGTGVNAIHYSITTMGSQTPIIGVISSSVGSVTFTATDINAIDFWAEDTLVPPQRETGQGPNGYRRFLFVTTTADSGVGSLRDTLVMAGPDDTILFHLKGNPNQPTQIILDRALPTITQPGITIDGLFPGCNGLPTVELVGRGRNKIGLNIQASHTTVRGLQFSNFNDYAILLDGTAKVIAHCTIEKNIISNQDGNGVSIGVLGNNANTTIKLSTVDVASMSATSTTEDQADFRCFCGSHAV
jgi:hypothetical protein